MSQKYFEKFPVIAYGDNQAVDITKRVVMLDRIASNPYIFYPYDISDGERADQLSANYYDDQYRSWILYLSNKITDPYYEWYLTNDQFYEYVTKKYGSYYDAQIKIKYYKNNWESDQDISVAAYNALTIDMQNYWEPKYGSGNRIDGYKRKQIDWELNTNKIVRYRVNDVNFIKDEICDIVYNTQFSGQGQVLKTYTDPTDTANNCVYLQHLSGTFIPNEKIPVTNSSYIYGRESKVNTAINILSDVPKITDQQFNNIITEESDYLVLENTLDVSLIANNITSAELEIYWSPVTYLEYEMNKNEFNKTINVLDSNLKQVMADNLEKLMSE